MKRPALKVPGVDTPHSLFYRAAKKRWVLKHKVEGKPNWPQAVAETEVQTDRQAIAWARAILLAPKSEPAASTTTGLTVAQLVDKWLELIKERPKLRGSTRGAKTSVLRSQVAKHIGDVRVDALTVEVLIGWVRKIRDQIAPLYLRNALQYFEEAIDDAILAKWTSLDNNPLRNPLLGHELPLLERLSGKTVVHVVRPSAQALLNDLSIAPHRWLRYLLAFATGLRDGEISGLVWANVYLDHEIPHVHVVQSVDSRRVVGPPKTEWSVRRVALWPPLVPILRAWLNEGWELFYGYGAPTPNDWVLPSQRGRGKPARPYTSGALRADLARLGLPTTDEGYELTFHATRRSLGTWLSEAGVEEATIGMLLGHKPKTVTGEAYTKESLPRGLRALGSFPLELPASLGAGAGAGTIEAPEGQTHSSETTSRSLAKSSTVDVDISNAAPSSRLSSLNMNFWVVLLARTPAREIRPQKLTVRRSRGAGGTTNGTMGAYLADPRPGVDWLPDAAPEVEHTAVALARTALRRAVRRRVG